jgi:hypothetical protein
MFLVTIGARFVNELLLRGTFLDLSFVFLLVFLILLNALCFRRALTIPAKVFLCNLFHMGIAS